MRSNSSAAPTAEILQRDPELAPHLDALGLSSLEEYTRWCARHGFSPRVDKHWRQRCKERYFASQDSIRERLTRHKTEKRRPRRVIEQIFDGDADEAGLTQPYLVLIQQTAAAVSRGPVRDALQQLLLHVEGHTGLLTAQHAFPQFGDCRGNTFIGGLLALAHNHSDWIRPPSEWNPRSRSARRQFSSLARHLLARYAVPPFMDSVWFRGPDEDAPRQQTWFKRIGSGESPRKLDLPIRLTRRMAHHLLRAPGHLSVDAALRWGQVLGLGGDAKLARALLGSRLAAEFENNEFWETVIRWFIRHPRLDLVQVGPLIDYIHRRKFESHVLEPTANRTDPPAGCSGFSMQGRTPASLVRQMREWHARLRKEPEKPQLEWPASSIAPLDWTAGDLGSNNLRRWTINQLLSRKALYDEGRVMRHCVAGYDNSCAFGGTSIWSMGVERNLGRRKRVLTIEVANAARQVCQARGKANRFPSRKEMSILLRWASQEKLTLAELAH